MDGIPLVREGDDIGSLILESLARANLAVKDYDILVVTSKIVSKAEGRIVKLSSITPSDYALDLAARTGRDARLCQLYIDESQEILQVRDRMVITRHKLGFENTNALIDRSNIGVPDEDLAILIPENPDASAQRIRQTLCAATSKEVAVIISDTFGRYDRYGAIGAAIGIAGISHIEITEKQDLYGRPSRTWVALVDAVAAGASVLTGESDEGIPVVLVSGVSYTVDNQASILKILGNTDDVWQHSWRHEPPPT